MEHLRIIQGEINEEEVSSSVIAKLADIAQEGLDETSDLRGAIKATHAYESDVNYLNENYPNLDINITGGIYISFEDSTVENILATNWGDGTGITQTQINSVTNLNNKFWKNSNLISFNELALFNNITQTNNYEFYNCTSLTSIDLSNIVTLQTETFRGCSNLTSVGDTSKLVNIGNGAFYGCTNLSSINLSNVQLIGGSYAFLKCSKVKDFINLSIPNLTGTLGSCAFGTCTQIKNVVNLGSITQYGENGSWATSGGDPFYGCSSLETVTIPATVTVLGDTSNHDAKTIKWVKLLCTQVPTVPYNEIFAAKWYNGEYVGSTYPIYVLDNLYDSYLAADLWSGLPSGRIRPMSQFAIDFPSE